MSKGKQESQVNKARHGIITMKLTQGPRKAPWPVVVKVVEHWKRWPSEVVKSQNLTRHGTGKPAFPNLALSRVVGKDDLQRTREMPDDLRKANTTSILKKDKEDPGNWPVCLTFLPGKVVEHIILEVITMHVEEKKINGSSQYGFTKRKSCLTNLIAFYDGMTGWVNKGRAVGVV
ncbi:hypothetical protein BTVI_95679 [Pitangus sulphuratus]|nr:hypothetical protein BTVI_95679 [Pitangus sulphuratus]